MIKAIIFDFFGVLTGDRWKEFVATLPKSKQQQARDLNNQLNRKLLSQKDFTVAIHELTGASLETVDAIINAEMQKNTELLAYIKKLSHQYKIGLLSNVSNNWITESFLTPDEVSLFDDIVLSHEVGMTKPEPALFHLTSRRLQSQPSECILVDDSEWNCRGASREGMQVVVYKNYVQCKADIDRLLSAT